MSVTSPSVTAVRGVIKTLLTDEQVGDFIADAVLVLEGLPKIVAMDAPRQAAIGKWLTAHLISQVDGKGGQKTAESMGDASESYAVTAGGLFLQSTRYGQQACAIDYSGSLVNLGKTPAMLSFL